MQEPGRRQTLQVRQPRLVLRQQHHRVAGQARPLRPLQRDLATDDRLHAFRGAVAGKFERTEQVGGVGDPNRGHAGFARQGGDFFGFDGAFAQGVGGVDSQVNEGH